MAHHGPTNPVYTGKCPTLRAAWMSGYHAGYATGRKRKDVDKLEKQISKLFNDIATLRNQKTTGL